MDLEEPETEIPSYVNSKPMHEYHDSRRYVSSPQWGNFAIFFFNRTRDISNVGFALVVIF